jgi:polyphosphate kinase
MYRKILVAPANLKDSFIDLIRREAEHARAGHPARIIAKMNALVASEVITALYEASQAGVEIDLLVRGICCLRPGIPGVSERIRVVSVVGRFLEHSRLFYFANAGNEEFYMGSADWMPRNLDRRVEVVVPIEDRTFHRRLMTLLEAYLGDHRQAWDLGPDGSYVQRTPLGDADIESHRRLLRDPWGLDRSESRYVTAEFRSAVLTPQPEPHEHAVLLVNGRRRKSGKRRPE